MAKKVQTAFSTWHKSNK